MEKEKKPIYKKWWFWLIVIILLISIFGGNSNNNSNTVNTSNISNNITAQTNNENKIVFLRDSDGKEFFDILCEVASVEKKSGVSMGETIDYASSNEKYGIELETNKNNEINFISVYTMLPNKDDYENFFIAMSRLKYNGSNSTECFQWIHNNLGKEATTKIGDANFKLYNGTSGNPVLEVFTDGNEEFQKEQLNKLTN